MSLPAPSPASTCLVTGASAGIGADIARELAARGHGVTLAARREDRLRTLASELADRHGVRVEVVPCDVADPAARERLPARIAERGLTVEVLVNNAGFGSGGLFHELDRETEIRMVRTNVEALVDLCSLYAPEMVARRRGAILNVASTVAFQPLPLQATYSASKSFVLSFTDSLHAELAPEGVTATALCPGLTRTEFADVAGIAEGQNKLPPIAWKDSREVARAAVEGLDRGAARVLPGAWNRTQATLGHLSPRRPFAWLYRRVTVIGR